MFGNYDTCFLGSCHSNQTHKLADVPNAILAEHANRSLDIASAYFYVSGYKELRQSLEAIGNFHLLLGFEPQLAVTSTPLTTSTSRRFTPTFEMNSALPSCPACVRRSSYPRTRA